MMCAPKTPKVPKTPVRQAPLLPDGGDPTAAIRARAARKISPGAMVFANKGGTVAVPNTTNPLGR